MSNRTGRTTKALPRSRRTSTKVKPAAVVSKPRPVAVENEDAPIDAIVTDPELQLRVKPHASKYIGEIKEAIERGVTITRLTVFRVDGKYLIADGHARLQAYRDAGVKEVPVAVHAGSRRDAWLYALGANAKHGNRRSKADMRNAIGLALADEQMRNWTNTAIAQVVHCSDVWVGKVKAELAGSSSSNLTDKRIGRDGKKYPAKKQRRPNPARDLVTLARKAPPLTDRVRLIASAAVGLPNIECPTELKELCDAIGELIAKLGNDAESHVREGATVDGGSIAAEVRGAS